MYMLYSTRECDVKTVHISPFDRHSDLDSSKVLKPFHINMRDISVNLESRRNLLKITC